MIGNTQNSVHFKFGVQREIFFGLYRNFSQVSVDKVARESLELGPDRESRESIETRITRIIR